jgi:hypothetical protein
MRLLVLFAVAAGIWVMRDRLSDPVVASDAKGRAKPAGASVPKARAALNLSEELCQTRPAVARRATFIAAVEADPFTEQSARVQVAQVVAKVVVAPVVEVVAPPPVAPPPPPPPPPLPKVPFRYLGMVNEKGEPAKVFLALGGALLTARAGDSLEGGFRLDSISTRELVFTHLQQQKAVRFGIDGEPQ